MKFLFLMDPLEGVKSLTDTSYIFMVGADRAGHDVYYLPNEGISLLDGELIFKVQKVKPINADFPFQYLGNGDELKGCDVDAVFIRTEPPFDDAYLMNMWLLDLLPKNVFVMNPPAGIRSVNEKVKAASFTKYTPPTLITQSKSKFIAFAQEHIDIIIKPTDGFGGAGVFKLNANDKNLNVTFETLSGNEAKKVIVQRYVPAAVKGDKRILLLNGEALGAVLRVNSGNDHRNNFYAGGTAEACDITENDKKVIAELKPHLQEAGLYFTGIDLLGDSLIEINVTSPTCLQETNRLYNCTLEDKVIEFVESKIKEIRS